MVNYSNLDKLLHYFASSQVQIVLVAIIILQFVNWVLEAYKLKVLLPTSGEQKINLIIKAVYIGNFTALLTPERMGNFVGRSWVLTFNKKDTIVSTIMGNYVQFSMTIIMAFLSFLFIDQITEHSIVFSKKYFFISFYFIFSSLIVFSFINLKWVKKLNRFSLLKSWSQSINTLVQITYNKKLLAIFLSFLRYLVFVLQFYLMSIAFDISISFHTTFIIVGIMFGVVTLIPSLIPGNVGVKEAFLLILLGAGSIGIKFSLISFSIWMINVGFSALIGAGLNIARLRN